VPDKHSGEGAASALETLHRQESRQRLTTALEPHREADEKAPQ
jgi:hypothetical protein